MAIAGRDDRETARQQLLKLSDHVIKLMAEKEQVVYWLCRLLSEAKDIDDHTKVGAASCLARLDYGRTRIETMLSFGEPCGPDGGFPHKGKGRGGN